MANSITSQSEGENDQHNGNEVVTYTYIPRSTPKQTESKAKPLHAHSAYPIAQPIYYAYPCYTYSYSPIIQDNHGTQYFYPLGILYSHSPQQVPVQDVYTYYPSQHRHSHEYPAAALCLPQSHSCTNRNQSGHSPTSIEYIPVQEAKHDTKPRKDGTLPWYGRTTQEVQDDRVIEQKHTAREAKKASKARAKVKSESESKPEPKKEDDARKLLEPRGKMSDQYWVVHRDGGMRAYPLGTIKANFEGVWKIDANGWPYLMEA